MGTQNFSLKSTATFKMYVSSRGVQDVLNGATLETLS